MISIAKRPRRKLFIATGMLSVVAIVIVLAITAYNSILNYTGYCIEEQRYLSDEEKIKIAVSYVISSYPPVLKSYTSREEDGVTQKVINFERPSKPIGYENAQDFRAINQNCCEVTAQGKDGYTPGFGDWISGRTSDFVKVEYLVRYIDDEGVERSENFTQWVAISNCGRSWSGV